jgi:hypothetical protein
MGNVLSELSKLIGIFFLMIVAMAPFIPQVQEKIRLYSSIALWLYIAYFAVIIFGIGFFTSGGHILGILIDRRKMVSLSKLQMLSWTILVISGIVTIAALKKADPLDIQIPETLWALMGISTVSLIGSPLLKNDNLETINKEVQERLPQAITDWRTKPENKEKEPTDKDIVGIKIKVEGIVKEEHRPKLKDPGKQDIIGSTVVNKDISYASVFDIFKGEEVGNYNLPDLGKIQMFIFTFFVWAAYAFQLITQIKDGAFSFPDLSEGMIGLIAISNAGYLAYKAVPRENPVS